MIYQESETIELKQQITNDLCKGVIAFANSHGGTIYVGVGDDGEIIGIDNADESTLRINNMVRDSIKPDVTMFVRYQTQNVNDKKIIAVTVQKGTDRPYYLASKGLRPSGVYVRNGTSTDPATDTAIRQMIKDTDGDNFESRRSLEQNLTFQAASEEFKKCHVDFDNNKLKILGLVSADGIYSNVGLLLSDQCPSTIKAATFAGINQDDFQDRREFGGSLFKQMEDTYAYLDMRNKLRAAFSGLYRIDTRDYPEKALREALVNSIVHRDYSYSASILVSVYDNRIEFVSIGGLLPGVSQKDIMLGLSVCRNPKLAAVFYRLKLIEAYGTGMKKIMEAYENFAVKPKLEITDNAFKITLPNCNYSIPQATSNNEEKILNYLGTHKYIFRSDVDTLLGVSQTTSSRILKQMINKGLVKQERLGRKAIYKKS